MNPGILVLTAAALAALVTAAPLPAQAPDLARAQAVADSVARAWVAEGVLPGLTVAVARNGETVFTRGYGKADLEMGADAGPETVYGISSITKQLTAAAVMRLVEAGRLSLDDGITKHLPDYPAQGHTVTIRHLLNHTSGIYPIRNANAVDDPEWYRRDLSYAQMVELFGTRPFEFEPGARYSYNNMGYYLLGEIIARVTGTPYAEHMERELQSLGLRGTVYCDHRRIVPNRAETYEALQAGGFVNTRYISMHIYGAAGAFCSTAADLLRWTHLLHAGQVVSPASLAQMTAPGVLTSGERIPYGYGLDLGELGTHRSVHHGGTNPWGAFLSHYPQDGLTIAVLTNAAGVGRERGAELEKLMARAAFGMEIPDLPLPAESIARYEGTYALQVGERTLDLRVFGENGKLMAQATGQRVSRLRWQGGDTFLHGSDDGIRLVFTVENGRASMVTLHQGGREIPGRRKP